MFRGLNLMSLTKGLILMQFFQEKIRSEYFLLTGKFLFRIWKGGRWRRILTQMTVHLQWRKTIISYLVFGPAFLSLSRKIIEDITQAMALDLKSQEMKAFQENLKIGSRHSLVSSVPYKIKHLAIALKKLKQRSIDSPTSVDFVN